MASRQYYRDSQGRFHGSAGAAKVTVGKAGGGGARPRAAAGTPARGGGVGARIFAGAARAARRPDVQFAAASAGSALAMAGMARAPRTTNAVVGVATAYGIARQVQRVASVHPARRNTGRSLKR